MNIIDRLKLNALAKDARTAILNADLDDVADAMSKALNTTVLIDSDAWAVARSCVVTEDGQRWPDAPEDEWEAAAYEFFEDMGINADAEFVIEFVGGTGREVHNCFSETDYVRGVIELVGDKLPAFMDALGGEQ